MPTGYTQEQLEYLHKRPANVVMYETVTFEHPAIPTFYIVANQFREYTFNVNGMQKAFKPASMQIPASQNQNSKVNGAGVISFGRIGMQFRKEMRKITRYTGFESLTATVAIYSSEFSDPIRKDVLLVAKGGISINETAVSIKLTLDNPAMVTKRERSYLPELFVGLK